MSRQIAKLYAIDPSGVGLIMQVQRFADRFGHEIVAVKDGIERVCFTSCEGTNVQEWPPSPPLQDYSIEEQVDEEQVARQVLLGVGMAGTGHWSLSVVADPACRSLAFDIACRAKKQPELLGSTYQIAPEQDCENKCVDEYKFRVGDVRVAIRPHSKDCEFSYADNRVALIAECPTVNQDVTIRWQYRVELLV